MDDMCRLHDNIPFILCKLECIFPPSFFDSMEYLPVHLPDEARIAGPVQYRWMYPFERYLRKLKNNVRNKAQVEGSICNAYLVEEASNFCSYYFGDHVHTRLRNEPRNYDSLGDVRDDNPNCLSIFKYPGRSFGKMSMRYLNDEEYKAATIYDLLNCSEIELYTKLFMEQMRIEHPNISSVEIDAKLEEEFPRWFGNYMAASSGSSSSDLGDHSEEASNGSSTEKRLPKIKIKKGNLTKSNLVSRTSTTIFKRNIHLDGITWGNVPESHKLLYFEELKKLIHWNRTKDAKVYDIWSRRSMHLYNDMLYKARQVGRRPTFMSEATWTAWNIRWSSEEFKKKLEQHERTE